MQYDAAVRELSAVKEDLIEGTLWLHFMESILDRIRRLVTRRWEPPVWYPLQAGEKTEHEN